MLNSFSSKQYHLHNLPASPVLSPDFGLVLCVGTEVIKVECIPCVNLLHRHSDQKEPHHTGIESSIPHLMTDFETNQILYERNESKGTKLSTTFKTSLLGSLQNKKYKCTSTA